MPPKGFVRVKEPVHGTYHMYNHHDCRCEMCCQALRDYKRTYYERHPSRYRDNALERTYGLTRQQFESMLMDQDGLCALCFRSMGDRYFDVDHCHTTRHIRGLLCRRCNNNLGWYETVRATVEPYLSKEHVYGKTPQR